MMNSSDFAWASELMLSKYGAEAHGRAARHEEVLRTVGCDGAASLWKRIAQLLEADRAASGGGTALG